MFGTVRSPACEQAMPRQVEQTATMDSYKTWISCAPAYLKTTIPLIYFLPDPCLTTS